MNKFAQKTIAASALIISFLVVATPTFAAAPDGLGPWADSVLSTHQGLMKNGQPVPAARSNPTAALGVAENTPAVDSTFYSLGFGGNMALGFDNGISNGAIVVEATNPSPPYPLETAKVELSADGNTWFMAGNVTQSGTVKQPSNLPCAKYVRITDISNPNIFPDAIADGYDVDGVKATGTPCTPVANCPTCCDTDITQTNNTSTTTIVQTGANSGKNKTTGNTGGNNTTTTGSANNNTNVSVGGSSNTATGGGTCCTGAGSVAITGNGKGSTNIANVNAIPIKTPAPVVLAKKVH